MNSSKFYPYFEEAVPRADSAFLAELPWKNDLPWPSTPRVCHVKLLAPMSQLAEVWRSNTTGDIELTGWQTPEAAPSGQNSTKCKLLDFPR